MNILVNHSGHQDWMYAMYALFELRLGHKLYSPNGDKEWQQFNIPRPGIVPTSPGSTKTFWNFPYYKDGIKHFKSTYTGHTCKFITFEQSMDMGIDIVLISNGRNEVSFHNLAQKYYPNSILIRQIANLHETPKICKNVLLATKTPMPEDVNYISHHMEPHPMYNYIPYKGPKNIRSFSNFLRIHTRDATTWNDMKGELKEFQFYMHGAKGTEGWIKQHLLHQAMKDSMFIWHTKAHGGGGFACQEALASGRPLVVKRRYSITHKTSAQDYLVDGVNCIDISPGVRTLEQAAAILREWTHLDNYEQKCQDVLDCYQEHFNFKTEAKHIKNWLTKLKPVSS